MLGLQAALNMAVATVSVPTKGLSLPLVSAGGSGLVITCAALGLLYSVTRYEHETAGEATDEEQPLLAAKLAQRFHARLMLRLPGLPALPELYREPAAEQLGLL